MPLILIVNSQFILCVFDTYGYSEIFSKFFIIRYNTARQAVMSDVHFRHKLFSIWDKKVGVHPLTFRPKSIITYMENKPLRVERRMLDCFMYRRRRKTEKIFELFSKKCWNGQKVLWNVQKTYSLRYIVSPNLL